MRDIAPKPDWAPAIWKDKANNVYLQFADGNVLRFDALDKAMKILPAVEAQKGYVSGRSNLRADHVLKKPIKMTKATERKRQLQSLDDKRRSHLMDLIRKANVKEGK